MIAKTEAIVLKSISYGETSLIVSAFSRELGRISLLARGARRPKSKFGSTLQTMSHIQAVVYKKEGRQILPVNEASHAKVRRNLSRDLDKIIVGMRVVELVRGLTQEQDPNTELFDLMIELLDNLDAENDRVFNLLLYFQMRLAALLGIEPQIVKSDVEKIDRDGYLSLDTGEVSAAPSPNGKASSRKALRTFAILARADRETICRMELDARTRQQVTMLVDAYYRYHFDEAYPDRSVKVLSRLMEVSSRNS